jgi:hypothetical protein
VSRGLEKRKRATDQRFCRAGRIRTADLLTPRQGEDGANLLVMAARKQNRWSEASTELPHFY